MKAVLCEHCGKWTKPQRRRTDFRDKMCRKCKVKRSDYKNVALCRRCLSIIQFAYRIKNGQKKKFLTMQKAKGI